jgi:predicted O-methyltransferase YrrM
MLDTIKLIARTALTGKPMPYSGLDLINRILVASGRAPETTATWNAWIEDLRSDTEMADTYESAKAIIAASWKGGDTKYLVSWSERLNRSAHLVDVFYGLMRALKPTKIIETGVAFGMTSSLIVAALRHNKNGHLLSIDLPNRGQFRVGDSDTGILVPNAYRDRWELVIADALYELPVRMKDSNIDIFIHDSKHTCSHMAYEYCLAAMHLLPNGLIISDDISWNSAFTDVMRGLKCRTFSHSRNHNLGVSVVARN